MGKSRRNADIDWDAFDSMHYFRKNYAKPLAVDEQLTLLGARAFYAYGRKGRTLDVGSGSNLIPTLIGVGQTTRQDLVDFSRANVNWLASELAAPLADSSWRHFAEIVADAKDMTKAEYENAWTSMVDEASIIQASVFDLPMERTYQNATMFFCAESITEQWAEFEEACQIFCNLVEPGGLLLSAFMEGSKGYTVSRQDLPAVAVDADLTATVLSRYSNVLEVIRIGAENSPVRAGHSGVLLAICQGN